MNDALLVATLSLAVPLQIEEWKRAGISLEAILAEGRKWAQVVAEKGDVIMFRGAKKGETAHAFSALAKGIAACAFAPGGIRIFGVHFEAKLEEAT